MIHRVPILPAVTVSLLVVVLIIVSQRQPKHTRDIVSAQITRQYDEVGTGESVPLLATSKSLLHEVIRPRWEVLRKGQGSLDFCATALSDCAMYTAPNHPGIMTVVYTARTDGGSGSAFIRIRVVKLPPRP